MAAALLLITVGGVVGRCSGEEARATTRLPSATEAPRGPESLLGALSFSSKREPISITSDAMEFDYGTRVLTYKGAVVVTQGDMKLESASLTVALDEHADNQVKEVVANGNVRLSKGSRWATGGHAVFDQGNNTVVLSEKAELHDGPNQINGDRVVVYLNEERSVVEGGNNSRVRAVLFPSQGEALPTPEGKTP
ncbi:MAG: lipopolysaccharide transport periplasmic protein LptA [Candidatus Binatia bacterium]